MPVTQQYRAETPYKDLGQGPVGDEGAPFYDVVQPAAFSQTIVRYRNERWAAYVGLDALELEEWANYFGKFEPLPHNLSKPLAMRYHGHQFRQYNSEIGDGRGFLYAQLRDRSNRLLDLGTKGSGTTPYSRRGDGRLTLKGAIREVLASEMLEALGVDTSKSFCVIETGEDLHRNDEPSPARSAVLTRLSHSHIRFGTFQRLAYYSQSDAINQLVDYCLTYYYPERTDVPADEKPYILFEAVIEKFAQTAARWMAAGFVHGVLNTDNMNITAESFDYGPWRFTEFADPSFTAAYFDHKRLYAYGRQAEAVGWGLAQLGGALAQIAQPQRLNDLLAAFPQRYTIEMVTAFFDRLGIYPGIDHHENMRFVSDLLAWMGEQEARFEQVFFDWFGGAASQERAAGSPINHLYADNRFVPLLDRLVTYEPKAAKRLEHYYFANRTPCTMLIEEMEQIWALIAENDDWSAFYAKIETIKSMRRALGLTQIDLY